MAIRWEQCGEIIKALNVVDNLIFFLSMALKKIAQVESNLKIGSYSSILEIRAYFEFNLKDQ